jgi:bifunctional N-acetylglucosamine-1-phosphate-uridyltransferase/glucosamine-1-phosphate-acetyltransferase GlmU-like protein
MGFDAKKTLEFYIRKGKVNEQFYNFDKRKIALLPYNTDQSDEIDPLLREDFRTFDGYLGDCIRAVNNKANKIVSEEADEDIEIGGENVRVEKTKKEKLLVKNKRALKTAILTQALKRTDCKDDTRDKLHAVLVR